MKLLYNCLKDPCKVMIFANFYLILNVYESTEEITAILISVWVCCVIRYEIIRNSSEIVFSKTVIKRQVSLRRPVLEYTTAHQNLRLFSLKKHWAEKEHFRVSGEFNFSRDKRKISRFV